jgi:hypothetical protein
MTGMTVTGPGITAGTTVKSESSGTITLSAATNAATSATTTYFFGFQAAATSGAIAGSAGSTTPTYSTGVFTFSDDSFVKTLAVGDVVTGSGMSASDKVASISNTAFTVTLVGTPTITTATTVTFTPPVYDAVSSISTSAATGNVTVTKAPTTAMYDAWVMNPSNTGATANAQSYLVGGFAVGQNSNTVPTLTAATVSPTGAITVGSSVTTTVSITGEGFGPLTTVALYPGTNTSGSTSVTTSSCNVNSTGTTITCYVVASSGAVAGAYTAVATNAGSSSAGLNNALTVAGPVVTAQSPASIAVGAPVGTVVTLTGTGFSGATSGSVSNGTMAGIFAVQSATTATVTLTASPTATDYSNYLNSNGPLLTLTQYTATGTVTATYSFAIGGAPTAGTLMNNAPWLAAPTTITSAAGSAIGTGATNLPIIINGSGFASGASIGSFVNANGVTDPGVTVSNVTYVSSTKLTATLSVAANDTNLSDGYTLTNASGAAIKVLAYSANALFLEAGPTVTAVSPATVNPGTTTVFTITGTNFASSNTIVTPTANGTCGSVSVASATTMTVTCTFGAAGTTATSLVVRNNDGGQATSAAVMAAAAVKPPVTVVNLHTTGAHGFAVVGKTVTITITGGGFYGQPTLTSTAAGVRAVVVKDNGTMLTVRVTTTSVHARGWHTFTIRLANGKMAKVNYLTK